MKFLHWFIHGESLAHRGSVLIGCLALVVLSCLLHGELGRLRVQRILNAMINQGTMTGMFWRVSKVEEHTVVVKGYQKEIRIRWPEKHDVKSGDRLSFVVQRNAGETEWVPEKIRVHGKAGLKYVLSGFAVIGVIISCGLHLGGEKLNVALKLDRGRRPCRTD